MSRHFLVGYASRAGSTAEVAEAVGLVLRESGASVDVLPVDDLKSIAGYDAVVLGTAIWAGKPLPEMRRFVAEQQDTLGRLPVACFILCDTLKEDTPANRQVALGYAAPLRAIQESVSPGLFAGARNFSKLHPLLRWFLMRVLRLAEGDWRDWSRIRAWAAELSVCLREPARAAV